MAIFSSLFFMLVLFILWQILGLIAGVLGFYKNEEGKTRWSIYVSFGFIITLGLTWELWLWASAKWGGAFVLGVVMGVIWMVIVPLQIIMAAARRLR